MISPIGQMEAASQLMKAPSIENSFVKEVGGFASELMTKVGSAQAEADRAIKAFSTGQNSNMHEVLLTVEKANISFQLMNNIRNKAVEAYQEIMRSQV